MATPKQSFLYPTVLGAVAVLTYASMAFGADSTVPRRKSTPASRQAQSRAAPQRSTPAQSAYNLSPSAPPYPHLILKSIDLTYMGVFQSAGNSFSPQLDWTPRYALDADVSVGVDLGASVVATVTGNQPAFDYQLVGNWKRWNPVQLGLGLGLQTWTSIGTYPMLSLLSLYRLQQRVLKVIDRLDLNYSVILVSNNLTHAVRIGVGTTF